MLADLELLPLLGQLGRPVQVGSVALGLMVARDIDLTVLCADLDAARVFDVVRPLAAHPRIRELRFRNDTGDLERRSRLPGRHLLGPALPQRGRGGLDARRLVHPRAEPPVRPRAPRVAAGSADAGDAAARSSRSRRPASAGRGTAATGSTPPCSTTASARRRRSARTSRARRSRDRSRRLVSIRHKPLLRPRELERVEGDRQVDDARRAGRREDAQGRPARCGPSTAAHLLRPDELTDGVVARTGDSQLLCGLADPSPRLGGGTSRRGEIRRRARGCEHPRERSRSAFPERASRRAARSSQIRHAGEKEGLCLIDTSPSGPARALRRSGLICAITRKLGRSRGTSWNSGFRQPSSSPRLS